MIWRPCGSGMMDVPVAEKPVDSTPRGRLRALYDWVTGATPSPDPSRKLAITPPPEGVPARIGRYAITRKLGEGGMGVVYAARDERLERTVALKTMLSLAGDETARRRFWREARAAASVNHPNICQIYEIGEDAGELFIAMELLDGEPLAERLGRGPLNVSEAMPVCLGMLAALSALHARGVVHRDLKPSNVFLTPHGVKLLDFGLARPELERSLESATGLTRSGIVMGTPRYMAPEQVAERRLDRVRCEQRPTRGFDELHGGAQLLAGAQQRAHDHTVDVGLRRQRLEVRCVTGEARRDRAGTDDERADARQRRRDRIGQAERQKVRLGIGTHDAERQHHEARERLGPDRRLVAAHAVNGTQLLGHRIG